MWFFIVGLGALIPYSLMLLFVTFKMRRLFFLSKIKEKSKVGYFLVLFLPAALLLISYLIDSVNSLLALTNFVVICSVCDLVCFKIRKIRKKERGKRYISGAIALGLTVIYLSLGVFFCYNVWKTDYSLTTKKDVKEPLTIIQISDSHMGTTFSGEKFLSYVETMSDANPDIVVITGDLVDNSTTKKDMVDACYALSKFNTKYGVYFVFGNHDKGSYASTNFTKEELIFELEKNGVIVLEDEVKLIGDSYYIVGRADASNKKRKSISELVSTLDKSKYLIVLNHQPNDYDNEEKAKVDLVLSGHTHGGQMIPIGLIGELSGANDKTYGYERRGETDFIVNSGISDWAIKFKTGTKSEWGYITISKE